MNNKVNGRKIALVLLQKVGTYNKSGLTLDREFFLSVFFLSGSDRTDKGTGFPYFLSISSSNLKQVIVAFNGLVTIASPPLKKKKKNAATTKSSLIFWKLKDPGS